MAKLPSIKKISREDVKDAPSYIERLIYPLNNFMEVIYYAFNKNITFKENILCVERTIDFSTIATYTTASPLEKGFNPLQFTHGLPSVSGVILKQIIEKSGSYIVQTTPICIDWRELNGSIYINYITGLKNSSNYTLKVLVLP